MDLLIRPARVEDAEEIASVHVASWREAYRGLVSPEGLKVNVPALVARWRERIEAFASVLVAEADGEVVGFSGADGEEEPDLANLHTLYLVPEWWGKGVGRDLLEETLGRLRGGEWEEVVLWVLSGNERACRFYEKAGFRRDGAVDVWRPETEALPMVRYRRPLV
jgi:RimJ/RimL family protein N-acetyltransferase